jgi:hypothetical protein
MTHLAERSNEGAHPVLSLMIEQHGTTTMPRFPGAIVNLDALCLYGVAQRWTMNLTKAQPNPKWHGLNSCDLMPLSFSRPAIGALYQQQRQNGHPFGRSTATTATASVARRLRLIGGDRRGRTVVSCVRIGSRGGSGYVGGYSQGTCHIGGACELKRSR